MVAVVEVLKVVVTNAEVVSVGVKIQIVLNSMLVHLVDLLLA